MWAHVYTMSTTRVAISARIERSLPRPVLITQPGFSILAVFDDFSRWGRPKFTIAALGQGESSTALDRSVTPLT
jgi:hypothetical protein